MSGSAALAAGLLLVGLAAALLAVELAERLHGARTRDRARERMHGFSDDAGRGDGGRDGDGEEDRARPSGLLKGLVERIFHRSEGTRKASQLAIETQLSELIDVVCLAMEGGMQFDAAFAMYAENFEGELALACRPASRMLRNGVAEREAVLSDLAESLGSRSFTRFIDTALRSLRYGSSLIPLLRQLSVETRRSCRADREEAVAKAPTKMLIPTGVLILPAMMILIAGPFMLELLGELG